MRPLPLPERFQRLVDLARQHGHDVPPGAMTWESLRVDIEDSDVHLRLFWAISRRLYRPPSTSGGPKKTKSIVAQPAGIATLIGRSLHRGFQATT
jgi:hypothetical protein